MMTIRIDGRIHVQGAPLAFKEAVRTALSIENPNYHRLLKINPRLRYAPHVTEFVRYYGYDKGTDTLSFGRGSADRLYSYIDRTGIAFELEDRRAVRDADLKGMAPIELRNYQVGAPEKLGGRDSGVARCDTGWGKSAVALELARQLNQRTLIIVPKVDILTQFVEDTKKFLGIKAGVMQGKNCTIADITVATVQTLQRMIAKGDIPYDAFGCVIVDECHLFVPEKTRSVVEFFHAKHRYGFTATNRRTDGQGGALEFIFGPVIIDEKMERAVPTVIQRVYEGKIEGVDYPEIIEAQVNDSVRLSMVATLVREEMSKGRKVLVLTKRVEHYKAIHALLPGDGIHMLESSTKKAERRENLDRYRNDPSSFDCLLGTFSLLSTGVDIPSLDTLIIAGDLRSDVLTEQSAGRIQRLFEGKEDPLIIDIVDTGNGILRNQARLRRKFYDAQGWKRRDF